MDAGNAGGKGRGGDNRRVSPRAKIEQSVRIRSTESDRPAEIRKTRDVSRTGFFFTTPSNQYYVGMRVYAALGYKADDPFTREVLCEVVRIEKLSPDIFGVAVHILLR